MPTISDLPDEVLKLILQHVITAPPHQSDSNSKHRGDTFHRVADWYTLASVDNRWQSIMQIQPVTLTLVFQSSDNNPLRRLDQLACSRLPVASLTILEPWAKLAFCGDGLVEYTGYSPGVVGRTIKQLLDSSTFKHSSGPVLQHIAFEGRGYFEFPAPPEAYPALRSLRGIGSYFVPVDLPPLLESLEYSAEPHPVFGGWGGRPPRFAAEKLEAAAKAVCGLGNLRWLVVKQCVETPLPPSFVAQLVAQLPTTLQAATFEDCLLADSSAGEESTCSWWRGLVPNHLQVAEWECKYKKVFRGPRGIYASFKLQAKSGML